jgi:hypothetical protein
MLSVVLCQRTEIGRGNAFGETAAAGMAAGRPAVGKKAWESGRFIGFASARFDVNPIGRALLVEDHAVAFRAPDAVTVLHVDRPAALGASVLRHSDLTWSVRPIAATIETQTMIVSASSPSAKQQ